MTEALKRRTPPHPRGGSLYDEDFYSWTEQQATFLRSGRFDLADVANLAQEIDSLGRSEAAALRSSYRLIAMHLLTMTHQAARATPSWENTIHRERLNAETMLADNQGFKRKRDGLFAEAYALARREAAFDTKLSLRRFPSDPPFTVDELESASFWPARFPLRQAPL